MATTIARRYAQALLEALRDTPAMEAAEEDLEGLRRVMAGAPGLGRLLAHPGVDPQRKQALVDAALGGLGCRPQTRRLVAILVERRRLRLIPEILEAYRGLKDRKLRMTAVEVTTTAPVAAGERAAWETTMRRIAGTPVRLEFRTDPDIIGGAVARMGSVVYDGSVRGSLERIRQSLLGE